MLASYISLLLHMQIKITTSSAGDLRWYLILIKDFLQPKQLKEKRGYSWTVILIIYCMYTCILTFLSDWLVVNHYTITTCQVIWTLESTKTVFSEQYR